MPRVVKNIEIYRAANQLIGRFGENAELETAHRADAALEQGDRFNFNRWSRINTAVVEQLAKRPKDGRPQG